MNSIGRLQVETSATESDDKLSDEWFTPATDLPELVDNDPSEFWLLYDSLVVVGGMQSLPSIPGHPLMTHVGSINIRDAGEEAEGRLADWEFGATKISTW